MFEKKPRKKEHIEIQIWNERHPEHILSFLKLLSLKKKKVARDRRESMGREESTEMGTASLPLPPPPSFIGGGGGGGRGRETFLSLTTFEFFQMKFE